MSDIERLLKSARTYYLEAGNLVREAPPYGIDTRRSNANLPKELPIPEKGGL